MSPCTFLRTCRWRAARFSSLVTSRAMLSRSRCALPRLQSYPLVGVAHSPSLCRRWEVAPCEFGRPLPPPSAYRFPLTLMRLFAPPPPAWTPGKRLDVDRVGRIQPVGRCPVRTAGPGILRPPDQASSGNPSVDSGGPMLKHQASGEGRAETGVHGSQMGRETLITLSGHLHGYRRVSPSDSILLVAP